MPLSFAVTWDYRCPFARIAHRYITDSLLDGADWQVQFVPFCLGQVHVEPGEPDIWDRPDDDSGLVAMQYAIAVRELQPDKFVAFHHRLFEGRHQSGMALDRADIIEELATDCGLDTPTLSDFVATGTPLAIIREEHTNAERSLDVWGVPTFMSETHAVFVRLMDLPESPGMARQKIEKIVEMLTEWPSLNEYKHTRLMR